VVDGAKLPANGRWLQVADALRCDVDYSEVGPDGQFLEPRIIKAFLK
jgi:hypothetical protein